jgi:signal peptidase I
MRPATAPSPAGPDVPPSPPSPQGHGRRLVRELVEVLVIAVVLYGLITLCLQTVRVDGPSMQPTLRSGDLLVADKLTYHLHAPERGDIVVVRQPGDVNRDIIKRVIGLPGDTIEIDGTYHLVDGRPRPAVLIKPAGTTSFEVLREPYLPDQGTNPWTDVVFCCDRTGRATTQPQPLLIPGDRFFVLGDNRNVSLDSRYIGLIPRPNILARARLRFWPLTRAGLLGNGPGLAPALLIPPPLVPLVRLTPDCRRCRRRGAGDRLPGRLRAAQGAGRLRRVGVLAHQPLDRRPDDRRGGQGAALRVRHLADGDDPLAVDLGQEGGQPVVVTAGDQPGGDRRLPGSGPGMVGGGQEGVVGERALGRAHPRMIARRATRQQVSGPAPAPPGRAAVSRSLQAGRRAPGRPTTG